MKNTKKRVVKAWAVIRPEEGILNADYLTPSECPAQVPSETLAIYSTKKLATEAKYNDDSISRPHDIVVPCEITYTP